jgi:hypothetical protein
MKRQEKRRRKLRKQLEEVRALRQVTAVLMGVTPDKAGRITGHKFLVNHKGDWCDTINRTCQEGYCQNCAAAASKRKEKND